MSLYRLNIAVQDEEAGTLTLEGDGFAAAGEISTLLVSPDVAAFLGMTEDEQRGARTLVDHYRRALQALYSGSDQWNPPSLDARAGSARAELVAGAERLLGAGRGQRLKQLSWRILNGSALLDGEVATELQLTDAQRSAIAEAAAQAEAIHQRVKDSFSNVRHAPATDAQPIARRQERLRGPQPIQDAARDADRGADERLLALLTPQQRQRFEEMKRGTR